jgi:uncharacterized protein YndB with AHSA1/START domain
MWSTEHSAETTARPERIWQLWSDVAGWKAWNGDVERSDLDGPFAPGSRITMTTSGRDAVELRLAEVREPELFVDEAELDGVVIRTTHLARAGDDGRTRVTYRMEITGPEADAVGAELGSAISGDFPETLGALVALAET